MGPNGFRLPPHGARRIDVHESPARPETFRFLNGLTRELFRIMHRHEFPNPFSVRNIILNIWQHKDLQTTSRSSL